MINLDRKRAAFLSACAAVTELEKTAHFAAMSSRNGELDEHMRRLAIWRSIKADALRGLKLAKLTVAESSRRVNLTTSTRRGAIRL